MLREVFKHFIQNYLQNWVTYMEMESSGPNAYLQYFLLYAC